MVIVLVCIPVCYVQMKLGALFKRGIVGIFGIVLPILKGETQFSSIKDSLYTSRDITDFKQIYHANITK